MSQELKSRLLTLGWGLLWQLVAVALDYAAQNLTGLNLPTELTVLLGLILAQISKYVRNKYCS